MLRFENIQRFNNIPFEEYLKIPAMSHSYLKGEYFGEADTIAETYKIKIGKQVDAFLTEPEKVDFKDPNFKIASHIATKIRLSRFGPHIERMEKQTSYTADVCYMNYRMSAKFRLDLLIPGLLVVDLKVTHERMAAIPGLIDYMGYRNQLWGYAKAAQVNSACLMIYSVPSDRMEIFNIPILSTNDFWRDKVLKFGKTLAA